MYMQFKSKDITIGLYVVCYRALKSDDHGWKKGDIYLDIQKEKGLGDLYHSQDALPEIQTGAGLLTYAENTRAIVSEYYEENPKIFRQEFKIVNLNEDTVSRFPLIHFILKKTFEEHLEIVNQIDEAQTKLGESYCKLNTLRFKREYRTALEDKVFMDYYLENNPTIEELIQKDDY